MKHRGLLGGTGILVFLLHAFAASGGTRYVSTNSPAPDGVYESWETAAHTIQDAVNAAANGEMIIVTNGVYATGSTWMSSVENRVCLSNNVAVRSVNGPQATIILGASGVRGVHMSARTSLDGFTVIGGNISSGYGGGIYGSNLQANVLNCVISSNTSYGGGGAYGVRVKTSILRGNRSTGYGGGAEFAHLFGCLLVGNSAQWGGGGADDGSLNACTVVSNFAGYYGGGVYRGTHINSIVYDNQAPKEANYDESAVFSYSCTTPLPLGDGNISTPPQFAGLATPYLLMGSPCIETATTDAWMLEEGNDLDGQSRPAGMPDMGAYEFRITAPTGALTGMLEVSTSHVLTGQPLAATVGLSGRATGYICDFGDGTRVTNLWQMSHRYATPGTYGVTLIISNFSGTAAVTSSVTVVQARVLHVRPDGSDAADGLSWGQAKATLQAAVDAAAPYETVRVTNGTYNTGGSTSGPAGPARTRVVVDKPLTIESVNGAGATWICGSAETENLVRGVYLAGGATLTGFTVTNGHAGTGCGGGIFAETNGVIRDCVVAGNTAQNGGGVYGGFVSNSLVTANSGVEGGGLRSAQAVRTEIVGNHATYGGGASDCVLDRCWLRGNVATTGGGSAWGEAYNSIMTRNTADHGGGGYSTTLRNCTVVKNTATIRYGGTCSALAHSSIVYYNEAPSDVNYNSELNMRNCCTYPRPSTWGGTGDEPKIADLDQPFLLPGSPCINAGGDQNWMAESLDYDGQMRMNGIVDMGADEYWSGMETGRISCSIAAAYTNITVYYNAPLQASIQGRVIGYRWDFGDGATASNSFALTHCYSQAGLYACVLTATNLTDSCSVTCLLDVASNRTYYVRVDGNDSLAGTNWASAKQTLQAAVDAAVPSAWVSVWVSNGVYDTGMSRQAGSSGVSNRLTLEKPFAVRSVNGCRETSIVGATNLRCVYLGAGATLDGFTVTGGRAGAENGGGIYAQAACVSNCIIASNSAGQGGGIYGGIIESCQIRANTASGGGGTYNTSAKNCLINLNTAGTAGGAWGGTLYSCSVVGNSASSQAGGMYDTMAYSSLIYYNTAPYSPDYGWSYYYGNQNGFAEHCCISQVVGGYGNITNAPFIVSVEEPRLLAGSPCIDAGFTQLSGVGGRDMDGEPRLNGPLDIGVDEYWPLGVTGSVACTITALETNIVAGRPTLFTLSVRGAALGHVCDFKDGSSATNAWTLWHTFSTPGVYPVTLTVSNLALSSSATVMVRVVSEYNVYVSPQGNDAADGLSWATAKATLQAAVDAAIPLSTVWVTNGTYSTGERVDPMTGATNRLWVWKPMIVRSVNGAEVTTLAGSGTTNVLMRCAALTNGVSFQGFTVTGGPAGGIWCADVSATVTACRVTDSGVWGISGGTVKNCVLVDNHGGGLSGCNTFGSAIYGNAGSGINGGSIDHCTVVRNGWGNSKDNLYLQGGVNGVNYYGSGTTVSNSIVHYNYPEMDLPATESDVPQLLSRSHLYRGSIRAGTAATGASGTDIDGEPWAYAPAAGCDEPATNPGGPLSVQILASHTNVAAGFVVAMEGLTEGVPASNHWDFGDGTFASNNAFVDHAWTRTGVHAVVFTAWNADHVSGVTATQAIRVASQAVYYVNVSNGAPLAPYVTRATAAVRIQDVLNQPMIPGNLVLVAAGTYRDGCTATTDGSNRVAVTTPVTLRSENGPASTVIAGDAACRGVYLCNGARLEGFSVVNGWASAWPNGAAGAGVRCESWRSVVSNCVIAANVSEYGAGIACGTVYNTRSSGNAGGFGPGSYQVRSFNCDFSWNGSGGSYYGVGGGVYGGVHYNALIVDNRMPGEGDYSGTGGGACGATLYNSTICGNSSSFGGTPNVAGCTMVNCLYDLSSTNFDAGYRLKAGSAYIDTGSNQAWMVEARDLAGLPRIISGRVDQGCYEFRPELTGPICVDKAGINPVYPYTNWTTAATTIQQGVDAATTGDLVVVRAGIYDQGTPDGTNRVSIRVPMVLCSESDKVADTVIDGAGAVRGMFVDARATIRGFTFRNGYVAEGGGGLAGSQATVMRCVFSGNTAGAGHGGGINLVSGRVVSCLVAGNVATNNLNSRDGGGIFAYGSTIQSCTIVDNYCGRNGSGVYFDRRANTDNVLENSIVVENTGSSSNLVAANSGGIGMVRVAYSCSPDVATLGGPDNSGAAPAFAARAGADAWRLTSTSVCVDAGATLEGVTGDLDGVPCLLDGNLDGIARPDMGAYEFIRPDADTDHDGQGDMDEVIGGTSPTNPASLFQVWSMHKDAAAFGLAWKGERGRIYCVQSRTNLLSGTWTNVGNALFTNIPGVGGTLDYTNSVEDKSYYRLRVRR